MLEMNNADISSLPGRRQFCISLLLYYSSFILNPRSTKYMNVTPNDETPTDPITDFLSVSFVSSNRSVDMSFAAGSGLENTIILLIGRPSNVYTFFIRYISLCILGNDTKTACTAKDATPCCFQSIDRFFFLKHFKLSLFLTILDTKLQETPLCDFTLGKICLGMFFVA